MNAQGQPVKGDGVKLQVGWRGEGYLRYNVQYHNNTRETAFMLKSSLFNVFDYIDGILVYLSKKYIILTLM